MQLLVESETSIDIEKTMSTVEEIKSDKVESLVIEESNKKCNGDSEIIKVNDNAEVGEDKQISNDIEKALINIPVANNVEAELSNVDLNDVICEQNSLEAGAQITESQVKSSEIETNGTNTEEKEIVETSDVILDEDDLEDDIISISQDPADNITEQQKETDAIDDNHISNGTECLDREIPSENTLSVELQKDVIEVIDDSENSPVPSDKEIEMPKEEEKESNDVSEDTSTSPIPCDTDKQQEDNDVVEVIEEPETTHTQEKIDSGVSVKKEKIDLTCENNIDLTEEVHENDTEVISEEPKETVADENEENKNKTDTTNANEIVKDEKFKFEETCQIELEEITGIKNESPDTNEIKKESPAEIKTNEIPPTEGVKPPTEQITNTTDSTETAIESATEILNKDAVDSPIELNDDVMEVENIETTKDNVTEVVDSPIPLKDDMDVDETVQDSINSKDTEVNEPITTTVNNVVETPSICKLSNTLDILSDDDEPAEAETTKPESPKVELPKVSDDNDKQCINIDEDDDIMLIDEDSSKTETTTPVCKAETTSVVTKDVEDNQAITESDTVEKLITEPNDVNDKDITKETTTPPVTELKETNVNIDIKEKSPERVIEPVEPPKPLLPKEFLKTAKKKLADMTRDDLEEFCVLKIVESIVDRTSLSEIKSKLKSITQSLDECKKKTLTLTKQNRDLQVVLKSVQEEQKKSTGTTPVTPLKITRSVGMQVIMEKIVPRKKVQPQNQNKNVNNAQVKNVNAQGPRQQRQAQTIPVPRLVPANAPALKTPNPIPQVNQVNTPIKTNITPNGVVKNTSPASKPEKRPHYKISSSVTVDLTDDEPPSKMPGGPKIAPAPPVRLVPPQNLMPPQRQPFGTSVNSPRKVYIPISGPQSQGLRPGQTIMLRTVPAPGIRPRLPAQVTKIDTNSMKGFKPSARHPAPLPFAMKQYQPPNWKTLPPPPDLNLSKVENGIVISWRIDNIPEDSYEEIASYQLYAYQETSLPPSTAQWKKIGDVKALPLPMACTLTQFMAGYKYYFAVRAVDIRSRLGPFSLPGSILLLSKSV